MKRQRKRITDYIIGVIVLCVITGAAVDFLRFPEWYLSTWRYQLQNDIKSGDERAIDYYISRYVANGRELFEFTKEF